MLYASATFLLSMDSNASRVAFTREWISQCSGFKVTIHTGLVLAEKASLYLINTPTRIYLIQQHKRSFNVKWNNFIAFWLVHLQWGHRCCGLSSALLVVLCCTGNTLTQESPGFFLILASPRATLNSVCILLFSLLGHQCGLPTPHNPGQPNLLNHTLNMYNSRKSSANTQLY